VKDPRVIEPGERMALDVLAARYPNDRPTIFVVGANAGDYSVEVLTRVPRARLFCFEPQGICDLAGYPDADVRVESLALSDHNGWLWLWRDKVGSYHASAHREAGHEELGEFQRVEVGAVRLEDYCALTGVERIDWLKLDCEGHELRVLAGAKLLMQLERISVIQFEFNELASLAGNTFLSFWNLLREHHFEFFREGEALEPIPEYDRADEAGEPLRNYLAVHRSARWMVA
jgi:FkbM family methyltransferase